MNTNQIFETDSVKKTRSGTTSKLETPVNILVAEDNEINQRVIVSFLRSINCEIDVVENGLLAVKAASIRRYDLVLMDIHMPHMNGVEASENIRTLPPPNGTVPIVAVTADDSEENRADCAKAGIDGFVSKPVDKFILINTISNYIDHPLPDIFSD